MNKKQSNKPSGTKKTKSNKSKLGAQTEQNKKMIRNPKEPEGKKTKEKHKCKQFLKKRKKKEIRNAKEENKKKRNAVSWTPHLARPRALACKSSIASICLDMELRGYRYRPTSLNFHRFNFFIHVLELIHCLVLSGN